MRNDLNRLDTWDVPNQWSEIEARLPTGVQPEPPQRSRLAAGLVATVVALAGLGFVFFQFRGLDEKAEPASPVGVQHLEVTERTIDTGLRFPEGAVSGYGSVWVATRHANREGGDLLRLDPETGDEIARIAMPALPGWEFGGAGLATGLDAVWVVAGATGESADTALYRVDPAVTGAPEEIAVGPGAGADVWVDETGIWIVTLPYRDDDPMIVYHLDPTTYELVGTTELPADWSQTVFGAGGWIWVWASTEGTAPAESLFKIDPANGQAVDRSQPGGGSEFSVVPSGDRIWYFHEGLRALDAATGQEVVGPLAGYQQGWGVPGIVADGSGGAWVTTSSTIARATLVHLDRDGRVVASTGPVLGPNTEGIAATFDPGSSSLWIVRYEDIVTRIGLEAAPPEPELFFPTAPDEGVYMAALLRGRVVVRDGCALIGQGDQYTIPIWRDGFTTERDSSGRLMVLDGDAETIAVDGETVEMGGGYVAEFEPADKVEPIDVQLERVAEMIDEPVPERCLQPDVYGIWLVGDTQPISP